jgi:adhesin/invasin
MRFRARALGMWLLTVFAASCGAVTPSDGEAARITIVSGDAQTAAVGERLADPLVVVVTDQDYEPMENMNVDFKVLEGGGTLSTQTVRTDSLGHAESLLTLGTKAGANVVEVRVQGLAIAPVMLGATAMAGAPTKLVKLTEDQNGTVNMPLVNALVVRLDDQYDNPVANQPITFSVMTNNGSLSTTSLMTGADGTASTQLTLGSAAGANAVEARSSAVPGGVVLFTATGFADSATRLVDNTVGTMTGIAGSALSAPFVVTALDASGNPVPGTAITFAVTAGGGTLSTVTIATDLDGRAVTTLTLGKSVGVNTVEARSGSLTAVAFTATGIAGTATKVIAISGGVQSGIIAGAQAAPLIALVTDANDNPVSGVSVTFTGGNVSPANAQSGANGRVQTMLTTAPLVGTNTIYASATAATSALFSVTTMPGAATQLVGLNTVAGSATVASTLQIDVQARDQNGNPVPGVAIAFAASGGSATASSPTTDAQGRVQASWTLPTAMGGYALSALSGSLPSLSWNVAATADAPASLTTTGDGQVTICDGDPLASPFVVTVFDKHGNRVPGTNVAFETSYGCFSSVTGCPQQATLTTNSQGAASVVFRTGTIGNGTSMVQSVNARVGGLLKVFNTTVNGC